MDRNTAEGTRKIVEKIFSQNFIQNICLDIFAKGICHAHQIDSKKWSVTLFAHPPKISLISGKLTVCSLQQDSIDLNLELHSLGGKNTGRLRRRHNWSAMGTFENAPIEYVSLSYTPRSLEDHQTIWPDVEESFLRFIEKAISQTNKLAGASKKSFSPGVVRYLRERLEYPISNPAYYEEETG